MLFARFSACAIAALLSLPAFAYEAPWPQTKSDIKADPAITFGTLPNGMRYAIMRNNTPDGALSLRLRIDAGSLQEDDAQRGIAHLLEHMAFRGSKKIPDGEVVKSLQRLGLRFGADTNASTAQTETIYKYDLPKSDAGSLDTGLTLLREVGDALNITDEALATERGVVLSEWRLSDTPRFHSQEALYEALFPGQLLAKRFPIGKRDIITNVDTATVRRYYEAYYRPERATLVVVGNVEPKDIEQKIVAQFSGWKGTGPSPEDPQLGVPVSQGLSARTFYEKSLPTAVSVSWLKPARTEIETLAFDKDATLSGIGMGIINQRLAQAALSDTRRFTSANVRHSFNFDRSADFTSLNIQTTPALWKEACAEAYRILSDVISRGVDQDEFDRAVASMRTGLKNQVAGAGTRNTRDLANYIVKTIDTNEVVESPADNSEKEGKIIDGLTPAMVLDALRKNFAGSGPVVFMTSAQPIDGAEEGLKAIFSADFASASKPPTAGQQAAIAWPYTDFGAPGKIVSQSKVDKIGATFVRFANGVELSVKPTAFRANQIEVLINVGTGRLGLPKNKPNASFLMSALIAGGLDAIDYPTIRKALAGKAVGLQASLSDSDIQLGGATTPADLETQLQIAAAYVSAPALRTGAFEQARQSLLTYIPEVEAEALANLRWTATPALHSEDPRWGSPAVQDVKSAKLEDLREWLVPMLRQGAMDVAITGDVNVENAIALTARTLGALPSRSPSVKRLTADGEVKFPAPTALPIVARHKGDAGKAALMIAWPAPDRRRNIEEAVDVQAMTAILQTRVTDAVRTKLGAGYSPRVSYGGSWSLAGYGAIVAVADTKPGQVDAILDIVKTITADLRDKPVAADEFDRAMKPSIAAALTSDQNNGFLAQFLLAPDVDPAYTAYLEKHVDLLRAVTPERAQAAAQKYLVDGKAWTEVMLPPQ